MSTDSTAAVEAVFRIEFPRLVAGLARRVGDVGLAEELAQDAIVAALRQWPAQGTPRNPGVWLMAVAKRRAVDRFRRDQALEAKYERIVTALSPTEGVDPLPDRTVIEDDRLRLMFVACHPVISLSARVALTLRLVGGLTTAEIARAYVQSEATIAQRIVRAKRAIARAGVPFEVPDGSERSARLSSVLEVVYLIYNEGYSATAGDDWMRPELCADAIRLGRLLAALMPDEPEVHGLLALMELQSSRLAARSGPGGEPVLLLEQERRLWDRLLIHRGLAALARADALCAQRGPYTLQAAIAACHARAFRVEQTDWTLIAELYGTLAERHPSPVVELNRAVALSMAYGPDLGLSLVDQIVETGTLAKYHLLHSVRGDLLDKLGRHMEAATEFRRAARLANNSRERQLSHQRAESSDRQARNSRPAG